MVSWLQSPWRGSSIDALVQAKTVSFYRACGRWFLKPDKRQILNIAFDVFSQAWPIVFPAGQLSCLINAKMPCKRIIVVTTYYFVTDNLWDIWELLVLEHLFDFFSAFRKAPSSQNFCLFVGFLQLGES